jgi:hypothetical protein
VLVSLALLTIIGGAVGISFTLGLRTLLAPGATQDRLAGARDQSFLEQLLSEDVGRAACIVAPVTGSDQDYGACNNGFTTAVQIREGFRTYPTSAVCSTSGWTDTHGVHWTALLCVGWPTDPETGTCEVAVYASQTAPSGSIQVVREEYAGGQSISSVAVTTDPVAVQAASLQTLTTASGNTWVRYLNLSIQGTGVSANRPTGDFQLRPLATDPISSAADASNGTTVC